MKKLLLFVSAMMLSLGSTAQSISIGLAPKPLAKAFTVKTLKRAKGVTPVVPKAATRAAGDTPEGTAKDYFMMKYSYRMGVSELTGNFATVTEKASIITAPDGKTVYIPAMFYTSLLSSNYLTGIWPTTAAR